MLPSVVVAGGRAALRGIVTAVLVRRFCPSHSMAWRAACGVSTAHTRTRS